MSKKNQRITAIDLWKIKRPSSPTLSPDGTQACVALTRYDMTENKGSTSLWLLSTFDGDPRELTRCGEKDGQPQWSPDGRSIAFVARRGEGKDADAEPQLYVIAPDGGEARRVSTIATGVAAIKWFPGAAKIAFISWVWPELKGEKAQAKRLKEKKDDKVKAHVVDHTCFRHWDHWLSDGRQPHVHVIDLKTGKCRDLFAGSKFSLQTADPGLADFDISPDGKCIAFCYNPNADARGDQAHHIAELDVKTGKVRTLTTKSPFSHYAPAYSPDGASIALLVQNMRRSMDDDFKLALILRNTGKIALISHWDRNINPPLRWAADAKSIYFTADEFGRLNVWRLAVGLKIPTLVAQGGTVTDFDVKADKVVFVRNNMSAAPKIFASDADGKNAAPIEAFNDALMAKFKLGQVREFTIKGWNNEPVQMWVVYPPDFDNRKKWPLLHNIHGGPHANWGDNFHQRWNNQVFAAQGYVVVCVNYHGSLGWGNKFLESNTGTFGSKEHADVEAATDFMLKQGYIDAKRLAASGGSYGGKMVAWMNGRNGAKKEGDRYKAYVCHAGCFDWVSMYAGDAGYWFDHSLSTNYWTDPAKFAAQNPIAFVKHMKTPTLVIHGALDYRVPDAQGLAYYSTLKALKVPARLVFFPDENHWILKPQNSRLWYKEYFAWLEKYVGKGPTK
ncbi:MAG: S9 family peptidase [Burkholderiales bacterium]|nr:S9 family peptidase [Burkholderiales bacterium]